MAVFPASGPGSNAPLTNNATPNSETGSMNIASNRSTPSKKPALNLGALGALGYGDIHDDNDDKDVEVKLVSLKVLHFGVTTWFFRQIRGHSNKFMQGRLCK